MANQKVCPRCGTDIAWSIPTQLCPRCLLQEGLDAGLRPRVIGDYELLEEVARGGMGVVYRARQKSLGRIVAVKLVLSGSYASERTLRRFRTEAETAARLQHPNIVAIHEVGEHEGQPYFSMDYVEGESLEALARHRPMEPRCAARYVRTIASAIHYAHQQGILHRDLKPTNILVDTFDQPRITDFGLARTLETESTQTVSGQVLGSPNFMPPEQAAGDHRHVSVRSDVYSLGAVLYYLLTGRLLFPAGNIPAVLDQVKNSEPVSPRLLSPGVSRDLETICLKCLEKAPARRYESALALAGDLGRFLEDHPILARPVSAAARAWRWCRRNPAVALLSAAVLVALGGGIVSSTIFALAQVRARAETQRQLQLVAAVSDFVRYDLLRSADPMETGTIPSLPTLLANASERLQGRFPDEPAVEGAIRQTLGFIYYRGLSELKLAERELKQALALLREQPGADHPETLRTEHYLASLYWEAGRYRESEAIARQTFQRMDRVLGPEHGDTLWCLNVWCLQLWELGRYGEAEELLKRLWDRSQHARGATDLLTLMAKGNLAHVYRDQGRLAEAETLYLEKLRVIEPLRGPDNPFTLNTRQALAELRRKKGRYEDARDLLIRTLDDSHGVLGPEHHWRLDYQCSLGGVYRELADYAAAEDLLVTTWESSRRVLGTGHPHSMEVMLELALLYVDQERFAEAEPLLIQVVEGRKSTYGERHPRTIAARNSIAMLYEGWGRADDAERWRVEREPPQ